MKDNIKRIKRLYDNHYFGVYGYRMYKYNLYPRFFTKPRLEPFVVFGNTVKYEVVASRQVTSVTFNGQPVLCKQFSKTRYFIFVPNQDGQLIIDNNTYQLVKQETNIITPESTIIISDRKEKADDNGEFLYRWIKDNHPEYRNVYFGLEQTSNHYQRLEQEGFKLVDINSKQFKSLYSKADVIVSSVAADYIENHKHARYQTGLPKSKFILLSHGVNIASNLTSGYIANQKINYYIHSTKFEAQQFADSKVFSSEQMPVIGMSRTAVTNKQAESNTILYMPRWTSDAFYLRNAKTSRLYLVLFQLVSSADFKQWLADSGYKFKIVIHPQLKHQISEFKQLANDTVEVVCGTEISYRQEIENCKVMVTDQSSVLFDGLWKGKPIIFYHHPNLEVKIDSFDPSKLGTVTTDISQLINTLDDVINSSKTKVIESKYLVDDIDNINSKIWELIVNG